MAGCGRSARGSWACFAQDVGRGERPPGQELVVLSRPCFPEPVELSSGRFLGRRGGGHDAGGAQAVVARQVRRGFRGRRVRRRRHFPGRRWRRLELEVGGRAGRVPTSSIGGPYITTISSSEGSSGGAAPRPKSLTRRSSASIDFAARSPSGWVRSEWRAQARRGLSERASPPRRGLATRPSPSGRGP